jgi:hypothetical protein
MGNLQASEMAALVRTGGTTLRAAVWWNLKANHYPPLPDSMIEVAMRAIKKARNGEWGARVRLPNDVTFRDGKRLITVAQAVESLHLDDLIEGEEEEGQW